MTGNAINAKSEALELRELSSEELSVIAGGSNMADMLGGIANAAVAAGEGVVTVVSTVQAGARLAGKLRDVLR
jgi:hypothetical protein